MNKKIHCAGYLVWFLGLALVVVADLIIRQASGRLHDLGMAEPAWFLSHLVLGVVAVSCVAISFKSSTRKEASLYTLIALLAGSVYYIAVIWLYIIGTGVDSV